MVEKHTRTSQRVYEGNIRNDPFLTKSLCVTQNVKKKILLQIFLC